MFNGDTLDIGVHIIGQMRFWIFSAMFYGDTLDIGVRIIVYGHLKGTFSVDFVGDK